MLGLVELLVEGEADMELATATKDHLVSSVLSGMMQCCILLLHKAEAFNLQMFCEGSKVTRPRCSVCSLAGSSNTVDWLARVHGCEVRAKRDTGLQQSKVSVHKDLHTHINVHTYVYTVHPHIIYVVLLPTLTGWFTDRVMSGVLKRKVSLSTKTESASFTVTKALMLTMSWSCTFPMYSEGGRVMGILRVAVGPKEEMTHVT